MQTETNRELLFMLKPRSIMPGRLLWILHNVPPKAGGGRRAHWWHCEAFAVACMHAFLIYVADFDHKLSCGGVSPESLTLRIALEKLRLRSAV